MAGRHSFHRAAVVALALLFPVLEGCAVTSPPPAAGEGGGAQACVALQQSGPQQSGPQQLGMIATAYFGRNIDSHLGVTAKDWQRFLDREVTPRFPDGLTVTDAAGQYRDTANGRLIREPSKVLTLILPADAGEQSAGLTKLSEVTDAYKRLFRQQSVLTVLTSACYAFR